jgi:hypothetical protein
MTDEQIVEAAEMQGLVKYEGYWHRIIYVEGFIDCAKWMQGQISDKKLREIAEAITRSAYIDDHLTPDEINVFVVNWFDYLKKKLGGE